MKATSLKDFGDLYERLAYPDKNRDKLIEAACDLVAMWKQQKIAGLSRAERNETIQILKDNLEMAVDCFNATVAKR